MAGSTVTVACKLPNGLHADITDDVGRVLKRVTFKGSASQRLVERADDNGRLREAEPVSGVRGGYGLTHGVDADFWERWAKDNANYPPVARGLIFAHATPGYVGTKAAEQAEITSGLEPMRPKDDPRMKGSNQRVEPDERHGV